MRYAASEKLEIIELVEGSHLSARQTLAKLGLPRTTFYRWYDRYLLRGEAGLQDQSPKPKHVWNRLVNANANFPRSAEVKIPSSLVW
jgi:putative transposase